MVKDSATSLEVSITSGYLSSTGRTDLRRWLLLVLTLYRCKYCSQFVPNTSWGFNWYIPPWHSERPKLYTSLAFLSAIGSRVWLYWVCFQGKHLFHFHFCRPALARCDIGVRFSIRPSVRPSIRPSFRPQFTSTLAFKSFQMTFSLKTLHSWILNFICSMTRLQGFRIVKFSRVENSRWPPLRKIAELLKSPFSPERFGIFGWNFVWSISRTLMLIDIKMKKICN